MNGMWNQQTHKAVEVQKTIVFLPFTHTWWAWHTHKGHPCVIRIRAKCIKSMSMFGTLVLKDILCYILEIVFVVLVPMRFYELTTMYVCAAHFWTLLRLAQQCREPSMLESQYKIMLKLIQWTRSSKKTKKIVGRTLVRIKCTLYAVRWTT